MPQKIFLYPASKFKLMINNPIKYTSDVAFTPAVKKLQEKNNSRRNYARMEQSRGWQSQITPQLEHFLQIMDSFYFSTANSQGQPYVQHRGGPKGFLKVLDHKTLAFADFAGNQQFITTGNLSENNKAYIFLMDYPNRRRIKIWGTAKIISNDEKLLASLSDPSYQARPERAILFTVSAWDSNCPQHIKQRFTKEDIQEITKPLYKKIETLEAIIKKHQIN